MPIEMTRDAAMRVAVARLAAAGVAEAARDARWLMRWAAGLDAAGLSAGLTEPMAPAEAARFERAVAARAARVPVAQITGSREFWGRAFRVTRDVLDPRPETETLIAAALERPASRILDLGTGSGCLLLTLLAEWPEATGIGTDASPAALAVAAGNAATLGISHRAAFLHADWFDGVAGRFDLILSNPPYLAEAEIAALASETRLHEPRMALTPGGDGLGACRRIAAGAAAHLCPGGRLVLEIGPTQAAAVTKLLSDAGLAVAAPMRDMDGRERALIAHFSLDGPEKARIGG